MVPRNCYYLFLGFIFTTLYTVWLFSPVVWPLQKTINGTREKELRFASQIWFLFFVLFSILDFLCDVLGNLTSLGLEQLSQLNHLRNLEGKILFGGTTNNF